MFVSIKFIFLILFGGSGRWNLSRISYFFSSISISLFKFFFFESFFFFKHFLPTQRLRYVLSSLQTSDSIWPKVDLFCLSVRFRLFNIFQISIRLQVLKAWYEKIMYYLLTLSFCFKICRITMKNNNDKNSNTVSLLNYRQICFIT